MRRKDTDRDRPVKRRANRPILVMTMLVAISMIPVGTTTAHDARDDMDDHGRLMLTFEETEESCNVQVVATNVDVSNVTLRIEHRPVKANPEVHHEEALTGTPEDDGDGFRFVAGPYAYGAGDLHDGDGFRDPGVVPLQRFILSWGDGEHTLHRDWSATGCAADPLLLVHQDETSGATHQVDGCTFFIEGRHIRAEEGRLELHGVQSDLLIEFAVNGNDTSREDGAGHRFFVGPVEVPLSGSYAIHFHPGDEGPTQGFRMPQVLGCSTEPPECPTDVETTTPSHLNSIRWGTIQDALGYRIYRSENGGEMTFLMEISHGVRSIALDREVDNGTLYEYRVTAFNEVGESEGCPAVVADRTAAGDDGDAGEEGDVCPPVTLTAVAHQDETVRVTVEGLTESAMLMRSSGGGAFEHVATLDGDNTIYDDTDTEVGLTYTYQLVVDSEVCAQAEATAIPNFPSVAAGALALVAGLLGYVTLRRRD